MFFNFKTKIKKDDKVVKKSDQQQEFQNILSFAKSVIKNYESTKKDLHDYRSLKHPIFEVINILGRKIHSDYMVRLLSVEDESDLESFLPPFMFPSQTILTPEGKTYHDLIKKVNVKRIANLKADTVIPWPWARGRLIDTITNIGPGRGWGSWKEDKINHYLELWLPFGLFWVNGGNHSISVGILQGTGTITADVVYDICNIYNYVYCDGKHYYRKFDNTIISEVKNLELAAIFEIGRLMIKHSISF
ncbi:DUF6710 family protein [Peribacillus simplex]|uniref:DUF6710 family protein n=1 Tax=Peribacillus simplex TaxID=1478 RepID=UPI00288B24EB|nr:DUF6710 family protein [Peribacillus simplex]